MPAWTHSSCLLWSRIDDNRSPVDDHFDECEATNLYRDGYWRWFMAVDRCDCTCHQIHAGDERVAKMDLTVNISVAIFFGFTGLFFLYVVFSS